MKSKELYVRCTCESLDHIIHLEEDLESEELIMSVHLNQSNGLLKRLVHAIKHILGFKCRYGNFDCVLLSKEKVSELKSFLESFGMRTTPEQVSSRKIKKGIDDIKSGKSNTAYNGGRKKEK